MSSSTVDDNLVSVGICHVFTLITVGNYSRLSFPELGSSTQPQFPRFAHLLLLRSSKCASTAL